MRFVHVMSTSVTKLQGAPTEKSSGQELHALAFNQMTEADREFMGYHYVCFDAVGAVWK